MQSAHPQTAPPMMAACPLGCAAGLQPTSILTREGALHRCPQCTLLVSPCTREQYEASLAKWDTDIGTLPGARAVARFGETARRRLAAARRLLPEVAAPRLLDVGCSTGSLLGVARDLGFTVEGVEAAPVAAAAARRNGFKVFTGTLQRADLAAASFDVITLIELVEHLPEPLDLLQTCHRLLRPRGVVLINTPNAASWTARVLGGRWEGFSLTRLGGHICFYSPPAMRHLAGRTGFDVVKISTRHVRLAEAGALSSMQYRLVKLAGETLAMPARWAGAGHDLLAILRRRP